MRVLFVNAVPIEAGGLAERTLGWLGERLTETGAEVRTVLARDHDSLLSCLSEADLVCVGELRPGFDLVVAGALAACGKPLVVLNHGYGFCHIGTRTCTDCALADGCRDSDRVAVYRDLHAAASLIVYLSPLHRQASEAFLSTYPDRTMVAPPPVLPTLPAPQPMDFRPQVAFCNPNDPQEWLNLLAHAYRTGDIDEPGSIRLMVYGAPGDDGSADTVPGLRRMPPVTQPALRLQLLADSSAFVCQPGRPMPFGAEALAAILQGHPVLFDQRLGFLSYPWDATDRATFLSSLADLWEPILASIRGCAGFSHQPRARRPTFSRPLLWAHRMGLGDSINLLPFARALAYSAPLTWVLPANHLSLLKDQCSARFVPDEEFDIEAARDQHDLILEVSVGMRQPYERLYQGDILGERWIRIDLARQANAYQSVYENLLSFLARSGTVALPGVPSIHPDHSRCETARHRLQEAGIAPADDLVLGVHPGSGREFKCWPAERFGALCARLRRELGARIVLFGGLGEQELVDGVMREAGGADLVSSGDPLPEVAALMSWITLHIGNDSGLTHLASACDVPVVALFGPTAAVTWGPTHRMRTIVTARDACGQPQRNMRLITVEQVFAAVRRSLARIAGEPPRHVDRTVFRLPTVSRAPDGSWQSAHARIEVSGDQAASHLDRLLERCASPRASRELTGEFSKELLEVALAAGLLGPTWLPRSGLGEKLAAEEGTAARPPESLRPRCGYLVETGFQHAFPVLAMLPVLPGPVFTTGTRLATRFAPLTQVVQVEERDIARALEEHGIDVVLTTSQRIPPDRIRSKSARRVVFIGHGESDKTHGQGSTPRPSFVHHRVNDSFDLIAVASHFHMARYRNPNRVLAGYLKHDLFVGGDYASRQTRPGWILWAPGWGRHSSVDAWLSPVVQATGRLGLTLTIHLHPFSYEAEPRLVQRVQAEVVRYEHVRMAHCANILDAMAPCRLMLTDVSSVGYDWLMFDRPVLFLDHEGLVIEEEKRLFWTGIHLSPGDDLEQALGFALEQPDRQRQDRRRALEEHFFQLDGKAAQRIRDEIVRRWRDAWCPPIR